MRNFPVPRLGEQLRNFRQDGGQIELLLERLKDLLLSLGAPDIAQEIGVTRAHVLQRLLAVQVLWPRRKIETLIIVRSITAAASIFRIGVVDDRVRDVDIDATQRIDRLDEAV